MRDRPSTYQLRAALVVARLIDKFGNAQSDTHRTYRHALTQGEYPLSQLEAGERLLLAIGLIEEQRDRLYPTKALHALAEIDDTVAVELLSTRAARAAQVLAESEDRRTALGAIGEELVAETCRDELRSLGRPELAKAVQRVSLVTDDLGYDVIAPTLGGLGRQLEVKTSGRQTGFAFRCFLSRNEFESGRRSPETWSLVACAAPADDSESPRLLGWCRVETLGPYLPQDGQGRWTEALVTLPLAALLPAVPPAV